MLQICGERTLCNTASCYIIYLMHMIVSSGRRPFEFREDIDNKKKKILKLLEVPELELDRYDPVGGYFVLIWACIADYEIALKLLKRRDIKINRIDNTNYRTALIWACCNKMESVALKLLERKEIDVNPDDKYDITVL